MNEPVPSVRQSPRALARLAVALPLLAWLSQIIVALYVHGAPAEFYLMAAAIQGFLILGGIVLGIWAIVCRGRGGRAVVIPATIGLVLSGGTLLLIGFVALIALLQ